VIPPAKAPAAGRGQAGQDAGAPGIGERDISGLLFAGEMYGVQVDQLARVLHVGDARARAIAGG